MGPGGLVRPPACLSHERGPQGCLVRDPLSIIRVLIQRTRIPSTVRSNTLHNTLGHEIRGESRCKHDNEVLASECECKTPSRAPG